KAADAGIRCADLVEVLGEAADLCLLLGRIWELTAVDLGLKSVDLCQQSFQLAPRSAGRGKVGENVFDSTADATAHARADPGLGPVGTAADADVMIAQRRRRDVGLLV